MEHRWILQVHEVTDTGEDMEVDRGVRGVARRGEELRADAAVALPGEDHRRDLEAPKGQAMAPPPGPDLSGTGA